MAKVSVTVDLALPADEVWALIGSFADLARWGTGIIGTAIEGRGVGSVRTLSLAQGGVLKERLEAEDQSQRSYTYSIIEGSLPVTNYRSTLQVDAAGKKSSRVTWSSSFEPKPGTSEARAVQIVTALHNSSLMAVKGKLGLA